MGVILQVALRPLVLGAGRLQRGAARAGARPRHGMCAEQADLATRLHHRHGRATSRKTALFSCGWAPLGSRSVERESSPRVSQSASAGDESSVQGREVYFVMLENI